MLNQDIRYTLKTNNFVCMLLMKYKIKYVIEYNNIYIQNIFNTSVLVLLKMCSIIIIVSISYSLFDGNIKYKSEQNIYSMLINFIKYIFIYFLYVSFIPKYQIIRNIYFKLLLFFIIRITHYYNQV